MINPDPFTEREKAFLETVRDKLIEIRNPKDYIDTRDFWFELSTHKQGSIPIIRFKPNPQAIKSEIMHEAGYDPDNKKTKHQTAKAFDSTWNRIFIRLKRHAREMTYINSLFTETGEATSPLISLLQTSIRPTQPDVSIQPKHPPKEKDYADELQKLS